MYLIWLYSGMEVRMNHKNRRIKSRDIYTINEPEFQGAAGPWRGTGAVLLLGGQGGFAPLKLLNFWNFKSTKPPFICIEICFFG